MAIVRMKRLELLAVSAQREEILRDLMLLGCVEISDPDEANADADCPCLLKRPASGLVDARSEYGRLTAAVKLLDKYAREKNKLFEPRPGVSADELLREDGLADNMELAEKIIYLDDQIRRIIIEQSRERANIEALKPWSPLDLPLDCEGTKLCFAMTGTAPKTAEPGAMASALGEAAPEAQLFFVSVDDDARYMLLICMRDKRDAALEALRSFGFAQTSLGALKGTARENIRVSEARLNDYAIGCAGLSEQIASLAPRRNALKKSADTVSTRMAREEVKERLLCSESAFAFAGWVPVSQTAEMAKALERYDCAWELKDPLPEEYPAVPVKLKNNRFTRALNMVTEMYSLPAYDGVDPNPLMAPFFILFYGIMMADMGYGLLMFLAAVIAKVKMKPRGGARNFVELLLMCSITTLAVGALTGSFFGSVPLEIARIINPGTTWTGLPALFTPLDDTVMILLGSMALGAVHIITGMAVSFVGKLKAGQVMDAVWEELTWWIVFLGIGLMALGVGNLGGVPVVLCLGGLMVVVGSGWGKKGLGKVTGLFGNLYNHVTGFFGDILSYSRLMALMLAGSVIAQVFNTIGAIFGNLVVFLIVSLVGNALNFALCLLGCYVHDLRLQCLEFFGKFYKDGGRPFRPLEIQTKYVSVINE